MIASLLLGLSVAGWLLLAPVTPPAIMRIPLRRLPIDKSKPHPLGA